MLGVMQAQTTVQIELTTICNFDCHYCAGRSMAQRHMDDALLQQVLDSMPTQQSLWVSLQGEGEPTLHPRFWEWAQAFRDKGHHVTTITNGTRINAQRCHEVLSNIGVSIDTLDADEAERIGRYNLPKVLSHFEELVQTMGPQRVRVHTVSYGQDVRPLLNYLQGLGVRAIVQPIQTKPDYARRYGDLPAVHVYRQRQRSVETYTCRFLDGRTPMRFVNIDGIEMPCCFIKDAGAFESTQHVREALARKVVPTPCLGCRELS